MKNRYWCLFVISLFFCFSINAQSGASISSDGKYVAAIIDKSLERNRPVLVVQSTEGNWKKEIPAGNSSFFLADNKHFIYRKKDSLFLIVLGTDVKKAIHNVATWKQAEDGNVNWLAYQLNNSNNDLVVFDLRSAVTKTYKGVQHYSFIQRGDVLFLQVSDSNGKCSLQTINLQTERAKVIWSGSGKIVDWCFDSEDRQLAFLLQGGEKNADSARSIWYYREGDDQAELLLSDDNTRQNEGLSISGDKIISYPGLGKAMQFSPQGSKLLFHLKEKAQPSYQRPSYTVYNFNEDYETYRSTKVDVWSYLDPKIQPHQIKDAGIERNFASIIDLVTRAVRRLEKSNKEVAIENNNHQIQFDDYYALVYQFKEDFFDWRTIDEGSRIIKGYPSADDWDWSKALLCKVYLIFLKDGSRKILNDSIKLLSASFPFYHILPDSKHVIWYDESRGNYFSYDIGSGVQRNISRHAKVDFYTGRRTNSGNRHFYSLKAFYGYTKNYGGILVADIHGDIWELDVTGQKTPECVTNRYAKRKSLEIAPVRSSSSILYKAGDKILLRAAKPHLYDFKGYYSLKIGSKGDPEVLVPEGGSFKYVQIDQAKSSDIYVVSRQNDKEPLNFFVTKDFKILNPITSGERESRVGINKELLTWKTFDGSIAQGILYKPKNFDLNKKYPVIITYYDWDRPLISFGTFEYYKKDGSYTTNISQDYLLFVIGIHYETGETGPNAYNCVVSGAQFLTKRPYVDSKKMGIYGVSFGGYETYYIVTHTNMFAAAYAGCGTTNFITGFGTISSDSRNEYAMVARGQYGIGVTPWDRPDIYLKNSPIFYADRISTPLLIGHNPNDWGVPFSQAVEMFSALRRLGKRVWMLVGETGHYTVGSDPSLPYFKQFFDHYLKGAPAPKWMVEPVPGREQGMAKWIELDSNGKTPPVGGLKWPKETFTPDQLHLLKKKTMVNNEGRIEDVVDDKNN
jgi:dipeptidyl aminopeptidase/acylaminoacyl peptidase